MLLLLQSVRNGETVLIPRVSLRFTLGSDRLGLSARIGDELYIHVSFGLSACV